MSNILFLMYQDVFLKSTGIVDDQGFVGWQTREVSTEIITPRSDQQGKNIYNRGQRKEDDRTVPVQDSRCNSSSPIGGIQGIANPAFLLLRAANATWAEKFKIEEDIFNHLKKTTGRGLYFEYLSLRFLGLRSKS